MKISHFSEHLVKTQWFNLEERMSFPSIWGPAHSSNSLTVARSFSFCICLFASMCWSQRTTCRCCSLHRSPGIKLKVISLGGVLLDHLFGPLKFLNFLVNLIRSRTTWGGESGEVSLASGRAHVYWINWDEKSHHPGCPMPTAGILESTRADKVRWALECTH